MEIIQEIKYFKNKNPRLYDSAEKQYLKTNEDVPVNPHGHIIIEDLTSYHAIRFFTLLFILYMD